MPRDLATTSFVYEFDIEGVTVATLEGKVTYAFIVGDDGPGVEEIALIGPKWADGPGSDLIEGTVTVDDRFELYYPLYEFLEGNEALHDEARQIREPDGLIQWQAA